MKTLNSSILDSILAQGANLGIVEETLVIQGLTLVLRSLRPSEHQAAALALKEVDENDYLYEHMLEYVSRSIVAVNGTDLRGVVTIATEEEDDKGNLRKVKRELHAYLRTHLVSTWGREALTTCYRKLLEVFDHAEEESKKGVVFHIPDESGDEKIRRLLTELREATQEVPHDLARRLLEEHGFYLGADKEEVENVEAKLASLSPTEEAPAPVAEPVARVPVYAATPAVSPGPPTDDEKVTSTRAQEAADLESLPGDLPSPGKSGTPVVARQAPRSIVGLDAPPKGGINPRFASPRRA